MAGRRALLLSHLLWQAGISSLVLERQSRAHVAARVRAGVLEQGTVDVLTRAGVGERLGREGLRHSGFSLAIDGRTCRVALEELTGRCVTVYGQTEVTRDLLEARAAADGILFFNVADVAIADIAAEPSVTFTHDASTHRIDCDFIVGCDGFHGVSRKSIPGDARLRI